MSFFKKIFTENLVKNLSIIFLAVYFIALTIFFIYSFITVHNLNMPKQPDVSKQPNVSEQLDVPKQPAVSTQQIDVNLHFFKITINPEIRLILIAVIMGILGGLLQSMWSLTIFVGNHTYNPRWFLWYVFRPLISVPLVIIIYFTLRGGILDWNSNGTDAVNEYGIAAICGLAGMFAKETLAKLQETFLILFKPNPQNTQYNNPVQSDNNQPANTEKTTQ